jgi:hypothetical protein
MTLAYNQTLVRSNLVSLIVYLQDQRSDEGGHHGNSVQQRALTRETTIAIVYGSAL